MDKANDTKHLNKRRRAAREMLVSLLYQMGMTGDYSDDARKRFLDELTEDISSKDPDFKYFNRYLAVVTENLEEIDAAICEASDNWRIGRIAKVDLAILRLATAEMIDSGSQGAIPQKVSINEAVELAKIFSGEKSPSFINGVLGKVVCNLSK
jgi:N utilization substance protein B